MELAAATYELPRLKRKWTHLERQMGSGAMRAGMGEKQMEIDKRLLRCATDAFFCHVTSMLGCRHGVVLIADARTAARAWIVNYFVHRSAAVATS